MDIFNTLLVIALALLFARILGHIFYKIKQPSVIGEIIAGILLGGVIILFFTGKYVSFYFIKFTLPNFDIHSSRSGLELFELLAEMGILFLLFISGLEISISKIKKMSKTSPFVAWGGVIFPFLFGFLTGVFFGLSMAESIIIGLILTATSVGVTVRTLMDLNVLDTDIGATILSSAVIDDVVGILLLAFALGIESLMDAVEIGVRIILFFVIFLYIGLKVIDKILDLGEKIHLPQTLLSITLTVILVYSFFADKAGLSGIIGAYVAGVLIGQNVRSKIISEEIKIISYSFFIPLFFVWVGLSLWTGPNIEISSLINIGILALTILIASIAGKIIGCFIGAKIGGMNVRDSLIVGIGMIPRMELALIIATTAIIQELIVGAIAHQVLIITIIMTIVTTLITPFLIKGLIKAKFI